MSKQHLACQLRDQARSCGIMGSPMYADLLEGAARDVEGGGVSYEVLKEHVLPGRGDAIALRFMAAVHRLVLEGEAPRLADLYPGVTGVPYDGSRVDEYWEVFEETLRDHISRVAELVKLPCQTNEVGRCAALSGGFLRLSARFGLPLRLLEVGASGGLNLRWDHFRYEASGDSFGPADSPVQLNRHWKSPPPHVHHEVEIVERIGCDLHPVDPASEEGALRLRSSVWGDQIDRLRRLEGAIEISRDVPATVEHESLEVWLRTRLAAPQEGVTTVVYHSIVEEYLPPPVRDEFYEILEAAGTRATAKAPLAHLKLESISKIRSHGLELTIWPDGEPQILARSGAHGQNVEWF